MSLCVPLGVACVIPGDPLLLAGHFPWLVLVPLLLGVQHGALAAAVSSALLGGVGLLHLQIRGLPLLQLGGRTEIESLGAFVAGCLAAGTIAGHFRDRTAARVAQLRQHTAKDAERLSRLARAHGVLRLSHQKLTEGVAARSWSLAGAFEDARRALSEAASPSALGDIVLNVLSSHAQVQAATLLLVEGRDARGRARLEVGATLGNVPPSPIELASHRLVQRSLASGRLVALDLESADGSDEPVLAVAPLCSAGGHWLGLVVIHELPFMAFQAESLNGLAALTALLADMLEDRIAGAESGWEEALFSTALAPEPHALGGDDDFVGTRTGTHRRRSVARSA